MKCPFCHYEDSRVIDSRLREEGAIVRRRRECIKCKRRFTTREQVEEIPLYVIKQDSRREVFDRNKLLRGIQLACSKRPVSLEKIEEIVSKIEMELRDTGKQEIDSEIIGNMVMVHLRNVDQVAYVRFASVYRKFDQKEEFINELKELS